MNTEEQDHLIRSFRKTSTRRRLIDDEENNENQNLSQYSLENSIMDSQSTFADLKPSTQKRGRLQKISQRKQEPEIEMEITYEKYKSDEEEKVTCLDDESEYEFEKENFGVRNGEVKLESLTKEKGSVYRSEGKKTGLKYEESFEKRSNSKRVNERSHYEDFKPIKINGKKK